MSSADLTLYTLTVQTAIGRANQRTYAESTIKGAIQKGGTNVNGIPLGNYAKYAWTLFTRAATSIGGAAGTIKEGDRILDPATNKLYEVLHVDPIMLLNSFSHYICELLETKTVHGVQKRTYTDPDYPRSAITGWLSGMASSYDLTSSVKMVISPQSTTSIQTPIGWYGKYDIIALTSETLYNAQEEEYDYIREGDIVWDPDFESDAEPPRKYYQVVLSVPYVTQQTTVSPTGKSIFTVLYLNRYDYYRRTHVTTDTWHKDSQDIKTDPRNRMKTWLDEYLDSEAFKTESGTYSLQYQVLFSGLDYPLTVEFSIIGNDLLFVVDHATATPRIGCDKKPYGFVETVPITIYALDSAYINATRIIEMAEQEIRRIATTYPYGSIRQIETASYKTEDLGIMKLYSATVNIRYTRTNDDYTPTAPSITYGHGYLNDFTTLSGTGYEWTETQDGSTGTFELYLDDYLHLNVSAAVGNKIYYVTLDDAIGASTSTYTTIYVRYRTGTSIKAKVIAVFSDASTQTVLNDTTSTTYQVAKVTLTAGKTLNYIRLYANGATGNVFYDYVLVCKGTYILPNLTALTPSTMLNDANIPIPGRAGTETQGLGMGDYEATLTCDLDVEPTALTWKRPQTTTPKTDYNNIDVLEEIHVKHADPVLNEPWQWITVDEKQFKARITRLNPDYNGDNNTVSFVVREVRVSGALEDSHESITERYGKNL
jgi:hypothetical protein